MTFSCRQVSGHGRTDQLLSAIRIIVRMPKPDCFLRYRMHSLHCNAEFYYVGKIPRIWLLGARRRRRNTVVGGKCALPRALLVTHAISVISVASVNSVKIIVARRTQSATHARTSHRHTVSMTPTRVNHVRRRRL